MALIKTSKLLNYFYCGVNSSIIKNMTIALNIFFHFLHIAIILSSITLWLFESTIVIHLWLQATILFSWLIIGPVFNKPGMCVVTEIQKKLGLNTNGHFPDSYMIYLYHKLGFEGASPKKIDLVTFSVFILCTLVSLVRL